jgi:hypothetical protein
MSSNELNVSWPTTRYLFDKSTRTRAHGEMDGNVALGTELCPLTRKSLVRMVALRTRASHLERVLQWHLERVLQWHLERVLHWHLERVRQT